MVPCAAIRGKELRLHQMLEERRFPDATVPDNGDVSVGPGTEFRQGRDSPILRLATGLEAAGRNIPLRQQALNDVQIMEAAAFPVGGDVI